MISITILEALGEVKIWGICLTESDLGSEGIFCDLSLVDTQGQAEQLGWNMSLWSEYCTDYSYSDKELLKLLFNFMVNWHIGISWKWWELILTNVLF